MSSPYSHGRSSAGRSRPRGFLRAWRPLAGACALLLAFLVAACGTGKKARDAAPAKALVWPFPPEEPRITFVQGISRPDDVGIKRSGFARVVHWVTGSDRGYEPLVKPFGVALDELGNICFTDTGANAVCLYDRVNRKWRRWDRLGKLRFVSPVALARRNGIFYVVDSGRASLLAFSDAGKLIFETTNRLERPAGLAVLSDRLAVVDSRRHCVVSFSFTGQYLSEFGRRGTAPGEFNFPSHVAVDSQNCLYVTDSMNYRIQVFDREGKYKFKVGRVGDSTGQFSRPKGVAVDSYGHIYVLDALFDNIQVFNQAGQFLLTVGDAGSEFGQFWLPNGIAIGRENEIVVTDTYNRRLQVFKYVGKE